MTRCRKLRRLSPRQTLRAKARAARPGSAAARGAAGYHLKRMRPRLWKCLGTRRARPAFRVSAVRAAKRAVMRQVAGAGAVRAGIPLCNNPIVGRLDSVIQRGTVTRGAIAHVNNKARE